MASMDAPVTTIKSCQKTIETDRHAFRWFLYLIQNSQVKNDFSKNEDIVQAYKKVDQHLIVFRSLSVVLLFLFLYCFLSKAYTVLLAGIPLLFFIYISNRTVRKNVSKIGLEIINKHFDEKLFSQHSFYMLTEELSAVYHLGGMVETMIKVDNIMRKLMILTLLTVVLFHPLDLLPALVTVIVIYQIGYLFLNSNWFYKTLTK